MRGRAFALPLVLLLVLISGLVILAMMERQATQAINVRRELEQYTFHHVSKGVQEAVEAWLRSSGGTRGLADNIEPDGHAFDLTLDTGQTVSIGMFDAQDTALYEMAGLTAQSRELARLMLQELRQRAPKNAGSLVRRDGPLPISVNTASPEVLFAAVNAATDGDGTDRIVNEILHARNEDIITPEALNGILTENVSDPEARGRLNQTITCQPTLWCVVAQAEAPSNVYPRPPARRYCGLVVLSAPSSGGGRDRATALQRNSLIIAWEDCTDQPPTWCPCNRQR
ncbi:MAG: hypothetical protein JSR77_10660 [Planctomycetes bacterium]|nr:hypothetical protein [Planctomycetota bacterium]